MKRLALAFLVLVVIGIPLALVAAAWLALEDQPAVVRAAALTPEQIARAKALAKAHAEQKRSRLRTLTVVAEDVDVAAHYAAAAYGGAARVVLQPGGLVLFATVPVPPNPFGRYLNVFAMLRETVALPRFESLRIGRLTVPAALADKLVEHAAARIAVELGARETAEIVEGVRMHADAIHVVYRWHGNLRRLREALLPAPEHERLRVYQEALARITAAGDLPREVSLRTLLAPLLVLAYTRSPTSDPAAENRAALVVLAAYLAGRGLSAVVPQAHAWPRPAARRVTLRGRRDLAQHFAVSAALAAAAGSPLADAVGLAKELDDAKRGSGFSFSDLAADRAGTLFGTHAVRSAESARRLQERVMAGLAEADFMPDVSDLPDSLSESEFKRRFAAPGAPAYRRVEDEIERRLAALALYR